MHYKKNNNWILILSMIISLLLGIKIGTELHRWLQDQSNMQSEIWVVIEGEPIYEAKVEPVYPYDPEVMDIWPYVEDATDEELAEEDYYNSLETLAILVQAEAGNQDLYGKRLVADVVLNRVDSKRFANSIEDVIFEPGQFNVVTNGGFDKAAKKNLSQARDAVELEVFGDSRLDYKVLFFNTKSGDFKYGDHWFSY